MPSSWAQWAVDFDGDGRIDLFNSPADAIGSVANYFKAHGWVPGMPVWYPARFQAEQLDLPTLLAPDILPSFALRRCCVWAYSLKAAWGMKDCWP